MKLIHYKTIDSTNTEVLRRLSSVQNIRSLDQTVIAAYEQTAGRGRLKRAFYSPAKTGIYFTAIHAPKEPIQAPAKLTAAAAVAVCRSLEELFKVDAKIKWVNDVYVSGKKVCGILAEGHLGPDGKIDAAAIGIGINIDQVVFPEEIEHKATSILLETGRHYDKNRLLAKFLDRLEGELLRNDLRMSQTALNEYKDLCATIGKSVTFTRGSRKINGMAVGVSENGELKVMLSDGSICNVYFGEVTVQGIY